MASGRGIAVVPPELLASVSSAPPAASGGPHASSRVNAAPILGAEFMGFPTSRSVGGWGGWGGWMVLWGTRGALTLHRGRPAVSVCRQRVCWNAIETDAPVMGKAQERRAFPIRGPCECRVAREREDELLHAPNQLIAQSATKLVEAAGQRAHELVPEPGPAVPALLHHGDLPPP